jgi:hypothetical protein
MYLNPAHMSPQFEARIVRWLESNGCRHWISREHPIIVRGAYAEYTALCRKDDKSLDRHLRGDGLILAGRKKIRLRIPLRKVA